MSILAEFPKPEYGTGTVPTPSEGGVTTVFAPETPEPPLTTPPIAAEPSSGQLAQMQDAVTALEAIYLAMQLAERLVDEAIQEHSRAFAFQIRDKIGAEAITLEEPYLDAERTRFTSQFVQTMERLFTQVEKLLSSENRKGHAAKSANCPISDEAWQQKAIDPNHSITLQIQERIAIESVRLSRRVKQSLDGKRQRALGIRRYIWRSHDDDKVRDAHAANDDKIFDWNHPPLTGHPGDEFGCRCWAEPTLDGAEEPLPEGVEVAALAPVIPVIIVVGNTLDKLNKARKLLQAAIAADALAQEIQQQEEEGDAEAPQPPTSSPSPETEPPEGEEPPEKDPDDDLFKRPDGVPEDWERKPADKNKGVKYVDPQNSSNDIRIMQGDKNARWSSQKRDYVRWKKDGRWLDKNGNPLPDKTDPRGHIPLEDFKFDPRIFK